MLLFIVLQSASKCNCIFLNSFRSKTVRRSYITQRNCFKHFALEIVGVDIVIYVSLQNKTLLGRKSWFFIYHWVGQSIKNYIWTFTANASHRQILYPLAIHSNKRLNFSLRNPNTQCLFEALEFFEQPRKFVLIMNFFAVCKKQTTFQFKLLSFKDS